jgi:hypothetical protein
MKSLPRLLCSHGSAHLCSANINDTGDMDLDRDMNRKENCTMILQHIKIQASRPKQLPEMETTVLFNF